MTHVGGIVDRGSATVPGYIVAVQWHKDFLLPGQTIVETELWSFTLGWWRPIRLTAFGHYRVVVFCFYKYFISYNAR